MESINMENNDTIKMCQICLTSDSKYVCPRCGLLYCSVKCYQDQVHARCSEEFYKECVISEFESVPANATDSRKRMVEMLKRLNETELESDTYSGDEFEEELDSDDDAVEDAELTDRLKGINLDDADQVWSKLNNIEKQQFKKLLESGNVDGILPEFEPWWDYKDDRKVIDLDEASYFDKVHKKKCPKMNEKIVPLSSICKASPSQIIRYNLVNILAGYSFTVRYYNGDHYEFCNEATVTLITISKNLSSNQNFLEFESAVESVFFEITNCSSLNAVINDSNNIKRDVLNILNGPDINNRKFYILAALHDIYSLFSKSLKLFNNKSSGMSSEFSKQFPSYSGTSISLNSTSVSVTRSKIKNCLKKIEYIESWVVEHYNSAPLLC